MDSPTPTPKSTITHCSRTNLTLNFKVERVSCLHLQCLDLQIEGQIYDEQYIFLRLDGRLSTCTHRDIRL